MMSISFRRVTLLVFLTLLPLPVAAQPLAHLQPPAPAFAGRLYLTNPVTPYMLQAIDPNTLADRAGSLNLGWSTADSTWLASSDGKTLVGIDGGTLVTVYDAQTGRQRAKYQTPDFVAQPLLSVDGTKLVGRYNTGEDATPAWWVLDATTGRIEQTIHGQTAGQQLGWLSPDGRRLYLLTIHDGGWVTDVANRGALGPWPTQMDAYNLATGQHLGHLTLPQVQGGFWQTSSPTKAQDPMIYDVDPGGALSPDGKTLALVDPRSASLVLIDTATLRVTKMLTIHQPEGPAHRLLAALSLVPRSASAKEIGTMSDRRVTFGPNGRQLYLSGYDATTGPDGRPQYRYLGLHAIDLGSGRIVASTLAGEAMTWMVAAPDGSGLYVEAQNNPGGLPITDEQVTLLRLAPDTLEHLASRAFDLPVQAIIAPAGS